MQEIHERQVAMVTKNIGLHQGSTLSLYLFALIMDDLIAHIKVELPSCMLFANKIVMVDALRVYVIASLKRWLKALKSDGFKISHKEMYI